MNKLALYRNKLSTMGAALMVLAATPISAFATTTADFDPAPIVTKIGTYAGYAMLIVVAFIGARWGLRALGLIGHK